MACCDRFVIELKLSHNVPVCTVCQVLDQLGMIDVSSSINKSAERTCLPEEGIELPKHLLLPLVEWMIVALSTLNLLAEKNSRGAARCQNRFFFVDLIHQEIHRAIEVFSTWFGGASCSDQLADDGVVGLIAGKRIA